MSCVPVAHLPRVSVAIALLKYLCSPNGVTEMFVVRGVAFACSASYLMHPSRTLYVVFQTLESIGYGASIAVLLLIMAMW